MRTKTIALVLGAVVLMSPMLRVRPAMAEDLVKATAALVLAEDPPLSRSQVLAKQAAENEKRAAAEAKAAKARESEETPYYKKWWFWALSAAVVGGTVALGVWAVQPSSQPAKSCTPGVIACFGDGRVSQ